MASVAASSGIPEVHLLDRYEPLIGVRRTERLVKKARALGDLRVLHINSTRNGGGVAEILSSLVPLMNAVGIASDWHVIDGPPEFFGFTKEIHNALHGEAVDLTDQKASLHREVVLDDAVRAALDYDVVIVHDAQPLPLIEMRQRQAWIWCCHVDLSAPDPDIWDYVAPIANLYDAAVFSLPEYAQELSIPQHFIKPAIDPFSPINQQLFRSQTIERLRQYHIPVDLPLVIQAGRFDKWKDPQGVVDAFCTASDQVAATLVLVGNTATDDPEGPAMFEAICASSGERIIVLSVDDPLLVNALQRRAAVVLQKSLREGFGLTVSEAMLKGKPVIGGNVGGIRHQVKEGQTGFLVDDVPQAAARIEELLSDAPLRRNMGRRAKERARKHFLMTRLMEDWLDLIAALTRRDRARVPHRQLTESSSS